MGAEPPLTGAAVNVTLCPEQILLPPFEVMLTAGVAAPEIVMLRVFEVAVVVVTH